MCCLTVFVACTIASAAREGIGEAAALLFEEGEASDIFIVYPQSGGDVSGGLVRKGGEDDSKNFGNLKNMPPSYSFRIKRDSLGGPIPTSSDV